jgi:hypothetical protein
MNNRTATIFICTVLGVLLIGTPAFAAGGPGLYELPLWADENGDIGVVSFWNSPKNLHINLIEGDVGGVHGWVEGHGPGLPRTGSQHQDCPLCRPVNFASAQCDIRDRGTHQLPNRIH